MTRPRAADDFSAIRARMEELRRERAGPQAAESELQQDQPMHRARSALAALGDHRRAGTGPSLRFSTRLGRGQGLLISA